MRFSSISTFLYLGSSLVSAASIPSTQDISIRDVPAIEQAYSDLEKRKGGGGGGRSGSSGGSSSSGSSSSGSSSSGSSSSGSSSSGSSRSGSSSSSSSYSFSSSSNLGGRTRSGSGIRPAYGGGRYYAGGATVPYTAGARSPLGIAPFLLPLAVLSFYPGIWLYGAYAYPYNYGYYYRNATAQAQNAVNNATNSIMNITCLCQQYNVCGCDDVNNNTAIASMMNITDGAEPQNSSIVQVVNFGNGTTKLFINGTLPNGTTASGGTDPSDASEIPSSIGSEVAKYSGYWVMAATVLATVSML